MAEIGSIKVKVEVDHEALRDSVTNLLLDFARWLIAERLMKTIAEKPDDRRCNDELVRDFLRGRQ